MPRYRDATGIEPGRGEVVGLIRQIQALVRELEALRRQGRRRGELRAKERSLDELRWRLAAVVRRTAARSGHTDPGFADR